jgi:hypothetical protein
MKQKLSTETPMRPQERLVIISYTTGLSFALERIGPLAEITIIVFHLLVLYLLALPNTPEKPFASIYSESLIKITCQHLLLLVGFDTLIYQKYYDTPPILVGHQLTGMQLMAFFLQRRIQPLESQVSKLWTYSGLIDPCRVSANDPEKKDLDKRVRSLTILTAKMEIPACTAAFFDSTHPLPEVLVL